MSQTTSSNKAAKRPSDEELLALAKIADGAIDNFRGNAHELQSALGMIFVGRRYGWKVLMLVHDRKTIRKYQQLLDIDVREYFPAVGDRAEKSVAYVAVQKISNFWKAVRGEIKGVKSPEINK